MRTTTAASKRREDTKNTLQTNETCFTDTTCLSISFNQVINTLVTLFRSIITISLSIHSSPFCLASRYPQ
jgi:uncharacterized protein